LPRLGAIVFAAEGPPRTYAKMHLGGSEPNFFGSGSAPLILSAHGQTIGLAICADSSKPSHPQTYAERDCTVYAAGVFLNGDWYATDSPRLAGYASRLRMLVVMANHAASPGTYVSVGRSAVWAPGGALLAEAAGTESCLVVAGRTREGWRGDVIQV
jgi:predicted amidohydrolase